MNRDFRLDFLRCLSIFLIFLAHTNPPNSILQIRNFDVVSMVIVSGMSFSLSYKVSPYLSYIFKRIKRLLIPTWKFLTIFFLFFFFLSLILNTETYSFSTIILTYTLIEGIGYVWIVKVFLILAIVNPFLYILNQKIAKNSYFVILIVLLLLFQKIIVVPISDFLPDPIDFAYDKVIAEATGYSIVALIGIRLVSLSKKHIGYGIILSAIWYVSELFLSNFAYVQNYKYPPNSYFLSYGIFFTFLIYYLIFNFKNKSNKFVSWTSKYSLDVYYWHILAIYLLDRFIVPGTLHFLIYYIYYLAFAFIITYLQKKYVPKLL